METIVTVVIFGVVMVVSVSIFNVCYGIQKLSDEVTETENKIMHKVEKDGYESYFVGEFTIEFEGKNVAPIEGKGSGVYEE